MAKPYGKSRRMLYPIPLVDVFDDPRVIALPPAGLGMLIRLLWHFWLTGCQPLPEADGLLFVLAQAQRPTWKAYKDTILAVCRDYTPRLAHAFEERSRKRIHMKLLSDRGAAKRSLQAEHARQDKVSRVGLPMSPRQIGQPSPTNQAGSAFRDR